MDRRIVPVEPASGRGELVVIEVQQQQGAHPLDVRLVGCEGENPYMVQSKGDLTPTTVAMLTWVQSNKASSQN